MVEQGEDLRILDNKTKEDITNSTFAQIIFEREKAKEKVLPLSTLRSMIQSGEYFEDDIQHPIGKLKDDLVSGSSMLENEGKNSIREFLKSTQISLDNLERNINLGLKNTVNEMTDYPVLERNIRAIDQRLKAVEKSMNRIEHLLNSEKATHLSGIFHDPYQDLPQ